MNIFSIHFLLQFKFCFFFLANIYYYYTTIKQFKLSLIFVTQQTTDEYKKINGETKADIEKRIEIKVYFLLLYYIRSLPQSTLSLEYK